jgi:hypothetical protein
MTPEQQKLFLRQAGIARFVYNSCLSALEDNEKSGFKTTIWRHLKCLNLTFTTLKKKDETFSFLKILYSQSLQAVVKRAHQIYFRFKRRKIGSVKRKTRRRSRPTLVYPQGVKIDFKTFTAKVPKLGKIQLCKDRTFSDAKIITSTLTRNRAGVYFLNVTFSKSVQKSKTPSTGKAVSAIDVLWNSQKYWPESLETRRITGKIYWLWKQRCELTTRNNKYKRLTNRMVKLGHLSDRQSKDLVHKLSKRIVDETQDHDILIDRDLLRESDWSDTIGPKYWAKLVSQIEYKCELTNKRVIKIGTTYEELKQQRQEAKEQRESEIKDKRQNTEDKPLKKAELESPKPEPKQLLKDKKERELNDFLSQQAFKVLGGGIEAFNRQFGSKLDCGGSHSSIKNEECQWDINRILWGSRASS